MARIIPLLPPPDTLPAGFANLASPLGLFFRPPTGFGPSVPAPVVFTLSSASLFLNVWGGGEVDLRGSCLAPMAKKTSPSAANPHFHGKKHCTGSSKNTFLFEFGGDTVLICLLRLSLHLNQTSSAPVLCLCHYLTQTGEFYFSQYWGGGS